MRRWQRGFTLMEVVITMALFGVFLWILVMLTAEMRGYDRRYPVNYLTHPQVGAVMARLRRDVFSAAPPYYPDSYETWSQSPKTLILYTQVETGFTETVVWDFTVPGEARRRAFSVGNVTADWVARGVPDFEVDSVHVPGSPYSVRIVAKDGAGKIAIDQQYQPRPHH